MIFDFIIPDSDKAILQNYIAAILEWYFINVLRLKGCVLLCYHHSPRVLNFVWYPKPPPSTYLEKETKVTKTDICIYPDPDKNSYLEHFFHTCPKNLISILLCEEEKGRAQLVVSTSHWPRLPLMIILTFIGIRKVNFKNILYLLEGIPTAQNKMQENDIYV